MTSLVPPYASATIRTKAQKWGIGLGYLGAALSLVPWATILLVYLLHAG